MLIWFITLKLKSFIGHYTVLSLFLIVQSIVGFWIRLPGLSGELVLFRDWTSRFTPRPEKDQTLLFFRLLLPVTHANGIQWLDHGVSLAQVFLDTAASVNTNYRTNQTISMDITQTMINQTHCLIILKNGQAQIK